MKVFRILTMLSAITSTGVQAAATGDIGIYLDWSSMSIVGATMTPATFTDPSTGTTFSTDGEGWVGDQYGPIDSAYAIDGADAIASYNDSIFNLTGGFNGTANTAGGSVNVSNAGPGIQSGYAGGWHGLFYQATGNGAVTISVDYSIDASVSTNSLNEFSTAGYEVLMDAVNADLWLSTYTAAITSGSTASEAELAAEAVAVLDEYTFNDWNLLTCSGETCNNAISSLAGTASVSFNVASGTIYAFGADATGNIYTDVNAVPVPAAVWLFGSGLISLIGVARRKART